MTRSFRIIGGLLAWLAGGCVLPWVPPTGAGTDSTVQASGSGPGANDVRSAPAAGPYFVDRVEGVVSYFLPADRRGSDSVWVAIPGDESWFGAAGLYDYDPVAGWTRSADGDVASADDVQQVNDPAP